MIFVVMDEVDLGKIARHGCRVQVSRSCESSRPSRLVQVWVSPERWTQQLFDRKSMLASSGSGRRDGMEGERED